MSIQLIRKAVPGADEAIVEYIDGYLRENDFEDDEDAIADFVKPILIDAGGDEAKIDELCEHLSSLLQANQKAAAPAKLSKLEHSFTMGNQSGLSATASLGRGSVDLEHASGRRVQSQVNQEKLRKAEAKIAAKMAKRNEKSNMKVEYEASRLLDEQKKLQEEYKLYNPILDYTTTKGKNKDIKIENFDISFAGRRILTDANLTVAFGRRYGVVGKNGIGKSTLLRAMSRREIAVPQHISLLYVEQEVSVEVEATFGSVLIVEIRYMVMKHLLLKWCFVLMSGVSICLERSANYLLESVLLKLNKTTRRNLMKRKRRQLKLKRTN